MSGKSTDYVVEKYSYNKGKGRGALAKILGIKSGSKDFHVLKTGDDLNDGNSRVGVLYSNYDHSNDHYGDNGYEKGRWKSKGKY